MPRLNLSKADARRLFANYHLTQTDVQGVFERLGSVQYDPLNPVGRNHDLVLQARVPGYEVGAWEEVVYGNSERSIYDAWDKQACLVPVSGWAHRRLYHAHFAPRWSERVLEPHRNAAEMTLAELEERGPLSSLEFTDQAPVEKWRGSWHGPKLVKNILRALWYTGQIVTHHRDKGRHVYSLPEEVIPKRYLAQEVSRGESLRHLITRRVQSAGLLRPNADAALWSLPVKSPERNELVRALAQEGALVRLELDAQTYLTLPHVLERLEHPSPEPRLTFLAPLDSFVWDRKALQHLFDFDYIWEVYKPERERKWGYYVLPVFYRDRFVARFDSRLVGDTWHLFRWWWEAGVKPDPEMLSTLEDAVRRFKRYLGADRVKLPRGLDKGARAAWQRGAKG